MAPQNNQTSLMLAKIDGKLDKIADQISDLSNRVTKLETAQGSHVSETERRFAALQQSIDRLETDLEGAKKEISQAQQALAQGQGGLGALRYVVGIVVALAGAGVGLGGQQIAQALQVADQAVAQTQATNP